MGLFDIFGAEGIRKAMRKSYLKHYRLAIEMDTATILDGTSPHQAALYGALGSRMKARRQAVVEIITWMELLPFMLLEETEGIETLSEYVVYQEMPKKANQQLLRRRLNLAIQRPLPEFWLKKLGEDPVMEMPKGEMTAINLAVIGFVNQCAWVNLLEPELYERIRAKAEEIMNDIAGE
ncbi:MAG: hypothetical protein PHR28_05010 [candidate division Zixibacteria bacterium]|nr:hypothetical protein [candidate division Zixibacteria bacterium]